MCTFLCERVTNFRNLMQCFSYLAILYFTIKHYNSIPHILQRDYEENRKTFFYSWTSLHLFYNYTWVFNSFKTSINSIFKYWPSTKSTTIYVSGLGKTPNSSGNDYKNNNNKNKNKQKKTTAREMEGILNMAASETVRLCKVNTGRCYSWVIVTEHWYFHPVWQIIWDQIPEDVLG